MDGLLCCMLGPRPEGVHLPPHFQDPAPTLGLGPRRCCRPLPPFISAASPYFGMMER